MLSGPKRFVTNLMTSFAWTNRLYLKKRVYNYEMDEKTIRGRLQHVGHRMDLHVSSDRPVAVSSVWEFEFLLDQVLARNLPIDEAMLWAFGVYVVAKRKLHSQYYAGIKQASQRQIGQEDDVRLLDMVLQRRSVRQWKAEPMDLQVIERIIDLAKWAPSSCNRQLWKVLLVNTEPEKQFLARYFSNSFWLKAPVLAVILMDSVIYGSHERHYAYLDGAGFIQNMLLLIQAFGYGACWIGFARWDTLGNLHTSSEDYEEFYRHFSLKKTLVPVSMIAMGKPDVVPRTIPRQDLATILIRDYYDK
jgi:nitroreductase